jgi:hypothetical protein
VHRGYHFITEQPAALTAATGIGREAIDRADYLKLDIHLRMHRDVYVIDCISHPLCG